MPDNSDKTNQLLEKLDMLLKRQEDFSREINILRLEIEWLKTSEREQAAKEASQKTSPLDKETKPDRIAEETGFENKKGVLTDNRRQPTKQDLPKQPIPPTKKNQKGKSDLEKLIGENLINKIGIAITVIGVGIGAKYAIDHELISPLTRIILGYLVGLGLLGFAIKLKGKYEKFSAVLLSGAMATLYFITFAAYSFYELMPQAIAFGFMLFFTAFTVVAAIKYNRQVIAHIGLVGAYAVPFLLSDGGKASVLFSYITVINIGILAIAFKKYWKPLYYSSFGLTWLIYFSWYVLDYQTNEDFGLALAFLSVFFAIFYMAFIAYKLFKNKKFNIGDILLLLINSFVFYGIGYALLDNHETGGELLGVFTLCNAIVHFVVSLAIYRKKLADRNLFYLISGLVLVFLTIAVPVQLDGNWVTLIWAGEATLFFWIGRSKSVPFYEKLSYPLMLLAFISIVQDWINIYDGYYFGKPATGTTPFFNITFLTSLLFVAAFAFINILQRKEDYASAFGSKPRLSKIVSYIVPAILLITLYYAFRLEISNYWDQLYARSAIRIDSGNGQYPDHFDYDFIRYKIVWVIDYSLLFVSLLAFANFRKFRNHALGLINLGLIVLTLVVFLTQGLYLLSELRESYLEQSQYYQNGVFNLWIRYVSFAFVALTLVACHKYLRRDFMKRDFKKAFGFLLHISVLWIASSELIHWMDIAGAAHSHKLGLSILWGVYSLFLISLGIWKKKKHLRIGAIALFGATLLKLFLYDISQLDTISKTIVFVSLGVLLLIISFLYHKYKHIISADETNN